MSRLADQSVMRLDPAYEVGGIVVEVQAYKRTTSRLGVMENTLRTFHCHLALPGVLSPLFPPLNFKGSGAHQWSTPEDTRGYKSVCRDYN
jgi:hypothetical protein